MLFGFALVLFSVFAIIFNVITVIAIIKERVAPSYIKVKISIAFNSVMVFVLGYLWFLGYDLSSYDSTWLIIFICLIIFYVIIIARRTGGN